jgi:two-component system, OmpR family, phosphate regulon sensor histidine kinase PhoR
MYNKHKMYKGGSNYTVKSANIIRYAGLLVPIILVVYGLCIKSGMVNTVHFFSDASFLALSFWWIYISIIQFLSPSRSKFDSAMRLIAYHLLAAAYLLFVSGIATPFVAFWILLMLAANTYFSRNGLILSILWFVIIVCIDVGWWLDDSMVIVAYDFVTLVAIVLSGLVTLAISRAQQVDRSELTKSKEQETLQRDRILTIVNNLADAIMSTDRNGVIKVYNAACLNLLDTNESLNGKHIDDILKLVDQDKAPVSLLELFKSSRSAMTRDDLNYSYDDGEQIRIEAKYSPIRSSYSRSKNGETHDGYIIIMRDITKAKSLEEERDEFISVVSHELRTPITIVEGTLSNLQIMMDHPNSTKQMLSDSVNTAHDQTIYLAKMVNDLSTLSRAERGVADATEIIDVKAMIHKLHDEYSKEADKKGLHLNLDLGARIGNVNASRLYLEEMLQNFITNAIKYTKQGTITVTVKQTKGVIKFAVKDSGIGISKPDQIKVFQKFYRSEDYRTRETSGTGLGLYVAAKLARKVGTTIILVSRLNHGSTFSFTLPATND